MKVIFLLLISILIFSCSFDDKSGIWKNENNITKKKKNSFSDFKKLSSENLIFNEIIPLKEKINFNNIPKTKNNNWEDIYYNQSNNYSNFNYNHNNKQVFKSSKISKFETNNFLLFKDNKFFINDVKGNIIVYSMDENKVISKFNFYKKRYKKIKKKLNLLLENNIVYTSDNLGFLYAYDFINDKILWAKNYKIPFRSNLKMFDNKLILANQNNDLLFVDKSNGDKLNLIPTEETLVNNEFINNLSLNDKNIFFLNTYGSLYSISKKDMKINWFVNLNQSKTLNPSNLFYGNEVVTKKNKVVVTSNKHTYVLDAQNGSIIFKKDFTSQIKPLIIDDYLFSITKNSLLVAINLVSGKILYSYNINEKISDFLKLNKESVHFKMLVLSNDKILIFLQNSYILRFNMNGDLEKVIKLPTQIKSNPIFIKNSIAFLDKKNKISLID